MENLSLKGVSVVKQRKMMQPYAVINSAGIEIFCGDYDSCVDHAMDVETGRIPSDLTIVPIY